MKRIAELDLPGYAIGGLAVGEEADEMYRIIELSSRICPPISRVILWVWELRSIFSRRYIAESIFFDCVMPSRNARHGNLFTWKGKLNVLNEKFIMDDKPIDEDCQCPACRRYSKAYIRHLFKARELLGMRLCVLHNLYFYNELMSEIRLALDEGRFEAFYKKYVPILGEKI